MKQKMAVVHNRALIKVCDFDFQFLMSKRVTTYVQRLAIAHCDFMHVAGQMASNTLLMLAVHKIQTNIIVLT
jgi:hypothetical protein